MVNDGIRSYTRREQRRLIEVIKFSIQFYWRVRRFEDWKLARLIRWNREVFNDPYFPFMDPQLIAYFSSPVPDFLIRVWEIFFIPNMQEEEKNYAIRFLTSLETFIMENIPSKWRNEMETSKIERIVFWLILHAFFNNFFYHLLILWLNNKLSIDNIHDSRVIPLDNRQKNLVIITISCFMMIEIIEILILLQSITIFFL